MYNFNLTRHLALTQADPDESGHELIHEFIYKICSLGRDESLIITEELYVYQLVCKTFFSFFFLTLISFSIIEFISIFS